MKGNGISMGCCGTCQNAVEASASIYYQRRDGTKGSLEREQEKGDKANRSKHFGMQ